VEERAPFVVDAEKLLCFNGATAMKPWKS